MPAGSCSYDCLADRCCGCQGMGRAYHPSPLNHIKTGDCNTRAAAKSNNLQQPFSSCMLSSVLDILILHHFHQVKGRKNTVNQLIQSVVIMVAHLTAAVKDHGRLVFLRYRIPLWKSGMSPPAGPVQRSSGRRTSGHPVHRKHPGCRIPPPYPYCGKRRGISEQCHAIF